MIFSMILAGGSGTRMGNTDIPKQYLNLGGTPIIIHTIEKFLLFPEIDDIVVVCPKAWVTYTKNLIFKMNYTKKVSVVEGGTTRHESIKEGLDYIRSQYKISDDDIVITHDAVRPFLSYRIIKENIESCKTYDAVDTVIPSHDTIVRSLDGTMIKEIPVRKEFFLGQTPQTFKINLLIDCYNGLDNESIESTTDAAKIVLLNNKNVYIVNGETTNIKITTPNDLVFANAILKEGNKDVK